MPFTGSTSVGAGRAERAASATPTPTTTSGGWLAGLNPLARARRRALARAAASAAPAVPPRPMEQLERRIAVSGPLALGAGGLMTNLPASTQFLPETVDYAAGPEGAAVAADPLAGGDGQGGGEDDDFGNGLMSSGAGLFAADAAGDLSGLLRPDARGNVPRWNGGFEGSGFEQLASTPVPSTFDVGDAGPLGVPPAAESSMPAPAPTATGGGLAGYSPISASSLAPEPVARGNEPTDRRWNEPLANEGGEDDDPTDGMLAPLRANSGGGGGGGGDGGEPNLADGGGGTASFAPPAAAVAADGTHGWVGVDVGSNESLGHFDIDDGSASIAGGGDGLGPTADSLAFGRRTMAGDGEIVARVGYFDGDGYGARAGLMIRADDGAGEAFAGVFVDYKGDATFAARTEAGAAALPEQVEGRPGGALAETGEGIWLKLARAGDRLVGFASDDGRDWSRVGSAFVPMGIEVKAGLAVTGGYAGAPPAAADFEQVSLGPVSRNVPLDWAAADIGGDLAAGQGVPGSSTYAGGNAPGGSFELGGGGQSPDDWSTSDSLQFAYRTLDGDGSIVAEVDELRGATPGSRAGLMFRDSLDPDAASVFVGLAGVADDGSNGNGNNNGGGGDKKDKADRIESRARDDKGKPAKVKTKAEQAEKKWLKLERSGDTFASYASDDGQAWELLDTQQATLSQTALVGMATTSGSESAATESSFRDPTVVEPIDPGTGNEVVDATGPASIDEGETYRLNLSASGFTPTSWSVDWGDGTVDALPGSATFAEHVYPDGDASFTIAYSATDGTTTEGGTKAVQVDDVARTASVAAEADLVEGAPFVLELVTDDPGDDPVSHWTVDWGDGTVEMIDGSPAAVQHDYDPSVSTATASATVTAEGVTYDAGSATFSVIPATPVGVAAAPAAFGGGIDLRWIDTSEREAGFRVERSGDGGTTWSEVHQAAAGATGFADTPANGLAAGQSYQYRVRAENAAGAFGGYSMVARATAPHAVGASGAAATREGSGYTLALDDRDVAATGWTIDWGDGEITYLGDAQPPEDETAASSPSTSGASSVGVPFSNTVEAHADGGGAASYYGSYYTGFSGSGRWGGFAAGDGVPSNATIEKVEVRLDLDNAGYGVGVVEVIGGQVGGQVNWNSNENGGNATTSGFEDRTFDLTGHRSWTHADLANGSLAVEVHVGGPGPVLIDHLELLVTYAVPNGGGGSGGGSVPSSVTHAYADGPADRVIVATANDAGGTSYGAAPVALTVNPSDATAVIAGTAEGEVNKNWALALDYADAGEDTAVEWRVDWGDGTSETITPSGGSGGDGSLTHKYQRPGNYVVRAVVADEDGSYRSNDLGVTIVGAGGGTTSFGGGGGGGGFAAMSFGGGGGGSGVAGGDPDLQEGGVLRLGTSGWTLGESGGTAAGKATAANDGGGLAVVEGDSHLASLWRTLSIPAGVTHLELAYADLRFDPRHRRARPRRVRDRGLRR